VRERKTKAEKRDMLRASRRTREEKHDGDEEDGDEIVVGARYCLETPRARTLLL